MKEGTDYSNFNIQLNANIYSKSLKQHFFYPKIIITGGDIEVRNCCSYRIHLFYQLIFRYFSELLFYDISFATFYFPAYCIYDCKLRAWTTWTPNNCTEQSLPETLVLFQLLKSNPQILCNPEVHFTMYNNPQLSLSWAIN
jgi:hypothetical protein